MPCQSQYRTVNCELAPSTWFTVSICSHVMDCIRGEAPAPAACLPALRSHRTRTITGVVPRRLHWDTTVCAKCWYLASRFQRGLQRSAPREPFLRESENPFLPLVLLLAWGQNGEGSRSSVALPGAAKIMQIKRTSTNFPALLQAHTTVGRATHRILPVTVLPSQRSCNPSSR